MSRRLLPFARRFIRNLRGNVAIIFALSLVPIVFLAGMALDFTSATQKRARLNAAADAAALSAVTPKMASQSIATAHAVAQAVFAGEASTVKGLSYSNPNINIVQNGLVRTSTVTYTAASSNAFQGILGQPAWARVVDRDVELLAQHQLLFAARQFAVHGHCGDDIRHQHDGRQHQVAGRLRLCLP
ncbi:MAG: pilus assembly protein TadG-related protein [Xanthobacteraceae bacterium]